MSTQILTALLVVFVLGLFVGSNLGVLLMCLLHAAKRDYVEDAQPVQVSVRADG